MEQPILNPQNPYVGTLRIFPGTLVRVNGRPRPNASRFAINFQTGPSLNPRDDLALHLSPCFSPPRIVRNSLRHGAWGAEEAWGNGQALSPHQPFEIIILAEQEQFKIALNGVHFCEFKHRISYPEITHLTIDGDVDIDRILISGSPSQPSYSDPYRQAPVYQPTSTAPYPTGPPMGMPMPSMYPSLPGGGPAPMAAGPYPPMPTQGGVYPPAGPVPVGSQYASGPMPAGYPMATGPYPQAGHPSGPMPTGATYHQGGYPSNQPYPQPQPGHSSGTTSTPFGNIPIGGKALGTLAGLGLGAAAGAAVLSAVNPLKHVKKVMKPKKMLKGFGRSSSSSSNSSYSSRSSFSSNSS